MRNLIKLITIIYFLCLCMSPSLAEEKTAVVNIDFLIKNTNAGKKTLKRINDLNNKNISELEKKNKDLKKLENEIKSKKNIISEQDFNLEVINFQQKVKDFTNEKNQTVNEFNNLRKKELEQLLKLFNPIISSYMEKNSINVLLDSKNIFMINKSSNLTDDILKLINNEIK